MMVPKGEQGSLLVSPSMCKQLAENGWLKEFQTKINRYVSCRLIGDHGHKANR